MAGTPEYYRAEMVEGLREGLRSAVAWPSQGLPEGFSISPADPTRAMCCLRSLRLKPGIVLRAYQFYEGGNGNGWVLAMPEDVPLPEPSQCRRSDVETAPGVFIDWPCPEEALEHFMDGIEGDGSARSYLEASVLFRELQEFGAIWHGCHWSTHKVIDTAPFDEASVKAGRSHGQPTPRRPEKWQWRGRRPADWRPSVSLRKDGGADVRFVTLSELGQSALYEHRDRYVPGSLRPKAGARVFADGPGGYVF
jgi:hypothetical protein